MFFQLDQLSKPGAQIPQTPRAGRVVLVALGVDEETADADAEGIEHHVSKETLAAFRRFLGRGE